MLLFTRFLEVQKKYEKGKIFKFYWSQLGFHGGSEGKETWVQSLGQEEPPKKEMATLLFLLGKFHRQRSLEGYSPWDHKESDTTERLTLSQFMEKEMVTHSSVLAWEIPWTEEPVGLHSMGSQRVGHDWANEHAGTHTHTHAEDYNTGNILQKALRTVLPLRGQSTVIHMFETKRVIHQMTCWLFAQSMSTCGKQMWVLGHCGLLGE